MIEFMDETELIAEFHEAGIWPEGEWAAKLESVSEALDYLSTTVHVSPVDPRLPFRIPLDDNLLIGGSYVHHTARYVTAQMEQEQARCRLLAAKQQHIIPQ